MLKEKCVGSLLLLIIYIKNVPVGQQRREQRFLPLPYEAEHQRPNIAPQNLKLRC